MTEEKSSESRRKLLKSIAAGSGAIVAGKSLPESWSRPVVDSVMLPAHAQTSLISCSPDPLTVVSNEPTGGTDRDAIAILFDGRTTCTLQAGDGPSDVGSPNIIFMADTDRDEDTWDPYTISGGNWTVTPVNFSYGQRWGDGNYSVDISGAAGQFRASFDVSVTVDSSTPTIPTITVGNVVITPTA